MHYEIKKLEKSQVELLITVDAADYQSDLESAAVRISERAAIKGFRPGKAPYEMVKQQMGEIKIMEEAMQSIVEKNFFQASKKEKLETIGMPQITIEKLAPRNEFVFKAVVALLPKIKLSGLDSIKIKIDDKTATDEDVAKTLEELRKMQPAETIKNGPATKDDKVVVGMDMFIDKVPVEGGQSKNHQVYLAEPHYIPGFAEELIGLKKDEEKEFTLKFPKDHYQKHLAGKQVEFKVKVNDVYELQYSDLDEEFAKKLGQENMDKLKELIKKNIGEDLKIKSEQKAEIEIFDKLIEQCEFEEIPDVLIDAEKKKMFHELKHNLEKQGIDMEQYFKDLKKTEEDIFKEFTENALKRVKAALISRQVAVENNIIADKTDIDKEIEMIKQAYKGDATVEENLKNPGVIETIALTIQNRKVVQWLKEKLIEKK